MKELYAIYGIKRDRGIRLWAELMVYLVQSAMCTNPLCGCIKEHKAITTVLTWPEALEQKELLYLHFITGLYTQVADNSFILVKNKIVGLDTSAAINTIEKYGNEAYAEMLVQIQQKLN